MGEKHRVADSADLPDGEGRCFEIAGKAVAVFRAGQSLYAVNDECPHAGGPLSEGTLEGGKVTCPWHRWTFDLQTGLSDRNAKIKTDCYVVVEEEGGIWVDL